MLLIQVLVVGFAVFALLRALGRFRSHAVGLRELVLWGGLWVGVAVLALDPGITQWFADRLGVGRGVDAAIYLALVTLFYALFRLHLGMRGLERQITLLVRRLAIERAPPPDQG